MQYIIQACCGQAIDVAAGQSITITDLEGQQVVDFFAEVQGNHNEFVSPGVTLDVNESLRLKTGDRIYSNLYRPMFLILHDDVCEHDLLHPCCRREMYDFFYHNGEGHPNCLENINHALKTAHPILQPINLFMHTELHADGSLSVDHMGMRLRVDEDTDLQGGEPVTLVVRPEGISLLGLEEPAPEGTALRGTIENYSFLGRMIRYWVRVGEEVFVIDDANVDLTGARSGDVQLRLDTRKLHVLKGGGADAAG